MCGCAARFPAIAGRIPPAMSISRSRTRARGIDAVIWKMAFSRMKIKPEEGLEVIVTGRLTTYPGRSNYQIVIETLEPAGVGALMKLLEERKKKLAAEGLFDEARKQLLPFLPRVIGVVTSPTGAVIRDILHRLADRFPRHVLVWPVRVQGDGAANEIAAAIRGFNALPEGGRIPRPDVLIVARGGGSLEDLWCFNEEIVVRAAADSMIPLISAVGHETDITLIDFASDRRAPTPTAAAEMAVPVRAELLSRIAALGARQVACWQRGLEIAQARIALARARLADARPAARRSPRQRLDTLSERLPRALRANAHVHHQQFSRIAGRLSPQLLRTRLERCNVLVEIVLRSAASALRNLPRRRRRDRVRSAGQLLNAFSYRGVLSRGFALVRDPEGRAAARGGGGQRRHAARDRIFRRPRRRHRRRPGAGRDGNVQDAQPKRHLSRQPKAAAAGAGQSFLKRTASAIPARA